MPAAMLRCRSLFAGLRQALGRSRQQSNCSSKCTTGTESVRTPCFCLVIKRLGNIGPRLWEFARIEETYLPWLQAASGPDFCPRSGQPFDYIPEQSLPDWQIYLDLLAGCGIDSGNPRMALGGLVHLRSSLESRLCPGLTALFSTYHTAAGLLVAAFRLAPERSRGECHLGPLRLTREENRAVGVVMAYLGHFPPHGRDRPGANQHRAGMMQVQTQKSTISFPVEFDQPD